jgi:hypothetical protein
MDAAMRLSELRDRALGARSRVERRKGERDTLQARQAELNETLRDARAAHQRTTQVTVLLTEAVEFAREQARQQVEALTTLGLQSVFGAGYRFSLEAGKIGNSPAVFCQVVSPYGDGDEIQTEGTDSRGGGIVDLQALTLRVAMLETYRPAIDGPMLLDEPCKHVSEEHVPSAGTFLREVNRQFGRQMIMVTHNPHLANLADRRIDVQLSDGASVVTDLA